MLPLTWTSAENNGSVRVYRGVVFTRTIGPFEAGERYAEVRIDMNDGVLWTTDDATLSVQIEIGERVRGRAANAIVYDDQQEEIPCLLSL